MPTENIHTEDPTFKNFHRSEVVQEIVSNKPGFLLKYGSVFFLITITLLVLTCWFIQYPDIVTTNAKLTSINAPKQVISKTTGKLIRLFAKEGDQTIQGTILGYIENTANIEEIILLSKCIDTATILLNKNNFENALLSLQNYYTNLGELQQNYQAFSTSYQSFKNYLNNGFYIRKKLMLKTDLSFLQKMSGNLLIQKELIIQDLALQQKTFDSYQTLNGDKVISELEYRNETSKLLNKKLMVPQIISLIINNEVLQNEKLKDITELDNIIAQQKEIFIQALNTFKSKIDDWKQKYFLIAPTSGKIAFTTFLQEDQQLQNNQTICFINPENTQYYAEIYIPQVNFGKVKTGQEVLLKFPAYPFQEYGSVNGKIEFISDIITDSGFLAKVILPNGLNTSYKKQVQFRDGLMAQGEIITQNTRLLQRFYQNIAKQFKK